MATFSEVVPTERRFMLGRAQAKALRSEQAVRAADVADQKPLVGLAFSGGGIRSATFNLGVLQELATLDILRHCDYLSTVSGGGYIGSWFSAWLHREGERLHNSSDPGQYSAEAAVDEIRRALS